MKIQTKTKRLLAMVIVCCMCTFSQAQPPGDPGPDPGGSVPIDGGLSLLVAAGIGYAAKKRHDSRKKNSAQQQNIDSNASDL